MLLIFAEVLGEFEFKYMGKKRNLIIKRSLWHNCRGHVAVRVEKGRNTMLVNSIVLGKMIPGTEGSRSAGGKYYTGDQRLLAWHNTSANIAESYSANQHLLTKRSIYKQSKLNLSLHAGRALEALNVVIYMILFYTTHSFLSSVGRINGSSILFIANSLQRMLFIC